MDKLVRANGNAFGQVFETLWENSYQITGQAEGLTPQECFDALGTDAAVMLNFAGQFAAVVNGLIPDTINITPPAGWTITPNQDGTVTVTKQG